MTDKAIVEEYPISDEELKGLVVRIAGMLNEGKAEDVIVLNLIGLTTITDYFIICTARSSVQTRALVRDIDEFLSNKKLKARNKIVSFESPWVLLDYNDFIVHIFLKEGRKFYQLERFWSDAKVVYSSKKGQMGGKFV